MNGALIGAIIAAVVSIIALIINYRITNQTLRHGVAREFGKISVELKIRQLNELYGPLRLLIEQNRHLALRLRQGKGDPMEWRLLDHISEVLGDPQDKAIVNEIIEIDGKIEQLIINNGGLVRTLGPPESFSLFLGHYKILKLAIDGKETPQIKEFEYYPRQLNDDVNNAFDAIKLEVDEIVALHKHMLKM